jgi:hypothetical protein
MALVLYVLFILLRSTPFSFSMRYLSFASDGICADGNPSLFRIAVKLLYLAVDNQALESIGRNYVIDAIVVLHSYGHYAPPTGFH